MVLTREQRAAVDAYGELQRKLQETAPLARKAEDLGQAIRGWLAELPAGESIELQGERYVLQVSSRQKQRKIMDIKGLFKALGTTRFLSIASVPLKTLDAILSTDERALYTSEEQTGPRRLVPVPRHQAVVIEMPKEARARTRAVA